MGNASPEGHTLRGLAVARIGMKSGYVILAGLGLLVFSLKVFPSIMGTHAVATLPSATGRSAIEAAKSPRVDLDRTLAGQASVIDGDTIEIHGTRIRFTGIDAPESRQTCEAHGVIYRCGQKAANALSDFIGARSVNCNKTGMDRYHRVTAKCFANGTDLSSWMVANGWAIAYRKYSMEYVADEERARTKKAGIWAGKFVVPEAWRNGEQRGE